MANGQINAFPNQIDVPLRYRQFDGDVGVLPKEFGEQRRNVKPTMRRRGIEPNQPSWRPLAVAYGRLNRVKVIHQLLCGLVERLSCFRDGDLA